MGVYIFNTRGNIPKSKQEEKSENIPTWVDDFRNEMSQTIKETMEKTPDEIYNG